MQFRQQTRLLRTSMLCSMAALYAIMLWMSWEPDTLSLMMPGSWDDAMRTGKVQFFPTLTSITTLLGRPLAAASAVVHILVVNLIYTAHLVQQTASEGTRWKDGYKELAGYHRWHAFSLAHRLIDGLSHAFSVQVTRFPSDIPSASASSRDPWPSSPTS